MAVLGVVTFERWWSLSEVQHLFESGAEDRAAIASFQAARRRCDDERARQAFAVAPGAQPMVVWHLRRLALAGAPAN